MSIPSERRRRTEAQHRAAREYWEWLERLVADMTPRTEDHAISGRQWTFTRNRDGTITMLCLDKAT